MIQSKFIIHKHQALKKGLHYDLRFKQPSPSLNWDSFASNLEYPTESGKKIYIVKTTIHSEEQALFTGEIPEGEYGAGKLTIWDKGSCIFHKYTKSHIIVEFKGSKMKGRYHLINVGVFNKRDYKKKVFMFFKSKDK